MQELQPLAFMPVRPPSRHIFHVSGVYQTRRDPVALQYVVERNPIDSCGFHGYRGDATTNQPSGHLLQIRREGWENPHGILIPVRRHSDEDFSRANVDTSGIRMKKGTVVQLHPFLSPPLFALAGYSLLFSGFFRLLLLTEHRLSSSAQATARSRNESTLLIGISLSADQTVTTVWRTEPGTTLVVGFNSTTDISAYFRTCAFTSVHPRRSRLSRPPARTNFLSCMAPRSGPLACQGISRVCRLRSGPGKNGAIIRKLIGYGHIPAEHAGKVHAFYAAHLNPYLNFDRPCGFATVSLDARGKRERRYKTGDYATPHEKLRMLPGVEKKLKSGISIEALDRKAAAMSDTEFARRLGAAKIKMLRACKIQSHCAPRTP